MLVFRPCLYSKCPEVPPLFRTGTRGGSGSVQRRSKKEKLRPMSILSALCRNHEKTNLHIWCQMKEKREDEDKKTFDMRNEEAGLQVVRTAIKTFKRGGGSMDFQGDLDFLSLTPGVVYAVKNNSTNAFFDLRDSTFEVVIHKMQKFFTYKVKNIAVSLDKVTVHHTS